MVVRLDWWYVWILCLETCLHVLSLCSLRTSGPIGCSLDVRQTAQPIFLFHCKCSRPMPPNQHNSGRYISHYLSVARARQSNQVVLDCYLISPHPLYPGLYPFRPGTHNPNATVALPGSNLQEGLPFTRWSNATHKPEAPAPR